jgi:hypothetical protein
MKDVRDSNWVLKVSQTPDVWMGKDTAGINYRLFTSSFHRGIFPDGHRKIKNSFWYTPTVLEFSTSALHGGLADQTSRHPVLLTDTWIKVKLSL